MKIRKKLKAWHLMPLSILALISLAIFVWFGRGDFSTKEVKVSIDGPTQVENGQLETFFAVIKNNSGKALLDVNLFIEIPSAFSLDNKDGGPESSIARIGAGEEYRVEFSLVASSDKSKENIRIRADYSPEGVSARFVSVATAEVIIGKLDVSMIFDLPNSIYSQQEVRGTIHIVPNSDIDTSPIYLKLNFPENFKLQDTNQDFDYETVWKLGNLREGDNIKREFLGIPQGSESSYSFNIQLGKLEGVTFLPLNSVEKIVEVSKSPIFLSQQVEGPPDNMIQAGDKIVIRVSYTNKSEQALEDVVVSAMISRDLIDTSSITASGATIDRNTGIIQWDKNTISNLRFVDIDEGGEFLASFNVKDNLVPANVNDTEKVVTIETKIKSQEDDLSLGGTILQADNKLTISITTDLKLDQDVVSVGQGEYVVHWGLSNTLNKAKSVQVEAVLPAYVKWIGDVAPSNENIQFISSSNTVIWNVGSVDVGMGSIFSPREAEFKIGLSGSDGSDILEQTKLTGIDEFTGAFLEQDIGQVNR
ncbi:MAG: hypothetical protein A3F94_00195 [Candidatus Spechtbacteria bacterium RIFCSPLOWO2_12_FULL_38_22]|uniref:DUF11 domain-containing protein n=1 Tax=Candidatus Spechtbacteria bacterium RIFCSPLOWO2_12_FULL_38_22 TaxID=1802165 RepID=A0A1G2HGD0_9BACT|nr:MAG: hypothetical protein A2728_01995 [Candidatus Spechtbacteria bacterium RIFCSPHIGHO2_01_FULL_38_11]OGZ59395.1 MAG: hypothetical protein A3E58_02215 [Candidatus Spechtbacteria bacterium RIFCSPHIGHO2_12_FULL_38_30]OGZ61547.1 MAG: hypothetical protein A3F94_00195 [Candidatus Spechtbacteria bacterium RIFCSPLOWO2_12_FULL_38_22]